MVVFESVCVDTGRDATVVAGAFIWHEEGDERRI